MIDKKLSKEMRWRVVVDICFFRIFARKKKNNMVAFALYRLPYANEYVRAVQHKGEVEELHRYTELNGKSGYVMAPFSASADVPILLMHPDETTTHNVNDEIKRFNDLHESIAVVENERQEQMERNRYAIDFANFHTQIMNGTFRKIVLARCKEIRTQENVNAEMLFLKACERYPRMFIALVSMPRSGTWMMATPEILLEGNGKQWRTMALAGTMKLKDDLKDFDIPFGDVSKTISWSAKDIEEQRHVATYINEAIEQFTYDYVEKGPYTCRAGNLVHLRSDFTFTLKEQERLGNFLHRLHPTPAVCGLPKEDVRRFILQNECTARRYYSGFTGILNPESETHLYVSLRCMEIKDHVCVLHAGGGLLRDSIEEKEWEETEAKMETMKELLE